MSTAPGLSLITVSDALALIAGEVVVVAVIVCEPTAAGAVYSPLELMVPVVALPPATPSTDHAKDAPVTPGMEAVNCCVADGSTVVVAGETVKLTTVIAALALPTALAMPAVMV